MSGYYYQAASLSLEAERAIVIKLSRERSVGLSVCLSSVLRKNGGSDWSTNVEKQDPPYANPAFCFIATLRTRSSMNETRPNRDKRQQANRAKTAVKQGHPSRKIGAKYFCSFLTTSRPHGEYLRKDTRNRQPGTALETTNCPYSHPKFHEFLSTNG